MDTSSIEVIQPHEGLEIRLPINLPQRAPPNSPESPRTNVAVPVPDDLLTEDEGTGDQNVPPTETPVTLDIKGRQETLSPTPQVSQTVRSAIELAVKDFEPSEQRIIDKCGEVNFQLSNHRDWNQPNSQLHQDICDLLPILYQSGFNTEGFPNLEDYLYQTVGTLPCQSLLHLALDSVFEEFPEISAIQTKVYHMLKCHLSVINHPSITQFDISLANHDFDRVVGLDFHNVSGTESRPDLSLQTDFNETYYSVFSQAQRQVYRVTERSLSKLRKDRANSCPDIVQQLNRDSDHFSNSNWRYTTANEPVYPDPYYLKNDQQTQTEITHTLQVKDTGAQYSSPSDSNDSSSSDLDSDIEGTGNITVAKRYLHRHSASSEDLYTNPTPPHKRFRTSTPEPPERRPNKEPIRCPLKEIINHRPTLHIPPVDLTVAPGRRAANVQLGRQRVNAMAARGRNPPAQPALQGADPALVQILQMMQNRDANRDNSCKQFLMFPKESFTGQDKKLAKSHWAEFSKYLDYQDQQGTIPRDLAHLPEIKSMFKLTLQDIALGWFKMESPTWLTEDQMKQSFLKRFNPWGDTRCQQQDAWNKLKFDMTKDDVDSFVVNMKTLASILGHNDDVILEKFKDVFPDPNIEAALIAMEDFVAMQIKAKQLVHIYKPAHDSPMTSAAILVHTVDNTPTKGKSLQPKSNQHQLAPINQPQENPNTGDTDYNGGQCGRGHGNDRGSRGCGNGGNSNNRYNHQDRGAGCSQGQWDFHYNRGRGQDNSYRGRRRQWDGNDLNNRDRDNRDRNSDGQGNANRGRRWDNNNRGQGHSAHGRGRRWNPNQQYHDPGYQQESQFSNPNHYHPPLMGHQYRYPIPYGQYSYPQQQQQHQSQMPPAPSQQATNICQLYKSQGHYDYQCQFAGDFMACTQKAFNQGRSYSHQDPNHWEWSQGDNDNNDPNGQPFQ